MWEWQGVCQERDETPDVPEGHAPRGRYSTQMPMYVYSGVTLI